MIIGVAKEIKTQEYRVSVTPDGAHELAKDGHQVLVEHDAGSGSGFPDAAYTDAGAQLVARPDLFSRAELIVKVKEPLPPEYDLLRPGQLLFTYLHLAPDTKQTDALIRRGVTAFAYETLEDENGDLPLLSPMSEVAGRMAPLVGSFYLQKPRGGTGLLPAGAPGTRAAKCLVLGGGVVGTAAARVALGIGMEVVLLNRGLPRMRRIDELFLGRVRTGPLTQTTVDHEVKDTDMVIGALLVTGGRTPAFLHRSTLPLMKAGSVIVDVSVDQGGCAETTVPRTHDDPVYTVDNVIHYTVANMPGAYPRTSTLALTNATLPWVRLIASQGAEKALASSLPLQKSLNIYKGTLVNERVAAAQGKSAKPLSSVLS